MLAVAAATLLAMDVQAADADTGIRPYFVAGVGLSQVDISDKTNSDAAAVARFLASVPGGTASVSAEDRSRVFSVGMGIRINRHLAVEGGYRSLGDFHSGYALGDGPSRTARDTRYKATSPGLSVLGMLPVTPALKVYGRLDLASVRSTVEESRSPSVRQPVTTQTVAMKMGYGVGAEQALAPDIFLRLEARRIAADFEGQTDSRKLDIDNVILSLVKAF